MCLPGTTYLVTRSCANRRYLLKPGPVVNDVMRYCAARAARDHRVELHAVSVQPNHQHIILTDFAADLSDFMRTFNRLVALCLMEHYKKSHPDQTLEGVWAKGHFSAVMLTTPNAVIDKVVYTLANPVKDALVVDYRKWPGWNSRPDDWLKPASSAKRPGLFFKQTDKASAFLPYQFTIPPLLRDRAPEQLIADIQVLIRDRQRQWHRAHAEDKRIILGVNAILAMDAFHAPKLPRARSALNPQLASSGEPLVMRQAQRMLRHFRARYRLAWCAFCRGVRTTFPAGTLLMRQRYSVACEELVPAWCACALACWPP